MYVLRRHNTVAHYIVTRTTLDLCEEAVPRSCMQVSKQWWEQEGLDLVGAREAAEAALEGGPE